MDDSEVDTERVVVRTYVPAYQREQWDEHADALDMSRSEFVRSMVQAGRRGFGADDADAPQSTLQSDPDSSDGSTVDGYDADANTSDPGGEDMEDRVIGILSEGGHLSWEELLEELTEDMEARLESALETLQAENEIRYSGRNGGYTLQHE